MVWCETFPFCNSILLILEHAVYCVLYSLVLLHAVRLVICTRGFLWACAYWTSSYGFLSYFPLFQYAFFSILSSKELAILSSLLFTLLKKTQTQPTFSWSIKIMNKTKARPNTCSLTLKNPLQFDQESTILTVVLRPFENTFPWFAYKVVF